MQDRQLYAQILGIETPWKVEDVELDREGGEVRVFVVWGSGRLECAECGARCPRHDTRRRSWRHLDTCQFRTVLEAEIPRTRCDEHGVRQVRLPWAESGSRFTALFEALVLDWLGEASISAVAEQLTLSWDEVDGIMRRAVKRGLQRRGRRLPTRIGVDETSFQKRHEYVTTVFDLDEANVVYVADGRKREAIDGFYDELGPDGCANIEIVAMDMWPAYIGSTRAHVPDADQKIVFDKFHIAKMLGHAVDLVRRREHRALRKQGDHRLEKSRYLWLQNPDRMSRERWAHFADLRRSNLRTARAWALKETAMELWGYRSRGWALRGWKKWLSWAMRCRIPEIKHVARTIKRHMVGILNAATSTVTNALAEGVNSRIQWIKKMACGFRNRDRFRTAIYFHLGGLDMTPDPLFSPT